MNLIYIVSLLCYNERICVHVKLALKTLSAFRDTKQILTIISLNHFGLVIVFNRNACDWLQFLTLQSHIVNRHNCSTVELMLHEYNNQIAVICLLFSFIKVTNYVTQSKSCNKIILLCIDLTSQSTHPAMPPSTRDKLLNSYGFAST